MEIVSCSEELRNSKKYSELFKDFYSYKTFFFSLSNCLKLYFKKTHN